MLIACTEQLPPFNQKVVAWLAGTKEHSGVNWSRRGWAFMVRHDDDQFTVADKWASSSYSDALRLIDADSANVTHWFPLPDAPNP